MPHLRLVHPAGQDPPAGPPKRRCYRAPVFFLTAEEQRHVRAALHGLRRAYGSWDCVAAAMGVREKLVEVAARSRNPRSSHALAYLTARAGGTSMEAVLTGKLTDAGRCASCGSRLADRLERARHAGGAP